MSLRNEKKEFHPCEHVGIYFGLGMFGVRFLIRFHNKSHRRDCSVDSTTFDSLLFLNGFHAVFIIVVVETSGIFRVFRHHFQRRCRQQIRDYERKKVKIWMIGMSIAVDFVIRPQ